jgi:hypothetical protein
MYFAAAGAKQRTCLPQSIRARGYTRCVMLIAAAQILVRWDRSLQSAISYGID